MRYFTNPSYTFCTKRIEINIFFGFILKANNVYKFPHDAQNNGILKSTPAIFNDWSCDLRTKKDLESTHVMLWHCLNLDTRLLRSSPSPFTSGRPTLTSAARRGAGEEIRKEPGLNKRDETVERQRIITKHGSTSTSTPLHPKPGKISFRGCNFVRAYKI